MGRGHDHLLVTTIFKPTPAVHAFLAASSDSRVVVVGDKKTAAAPWRQLSQEQQGRVIYLPVDDQRNASLQVASVLSWNHFGRKNLGFLYAVKHGARWCFDFDDDNILGRVDSNRTHTLYHMYHAILHGRACVHLGGTQHHLYNPYPDFGPSSSPRPVDRENLIVWLRGFPLEFITTRETYSQPAASDVALTEVAVFQSLADHNPDVDAIYRMTRKLPLSFHVHHEVRALPRGTYAPFNAQATVWRTPAFWAMLLPVTVASRVADIWRAYICERLL